MKTNYLLCFTKFNCVTLLLALWFSYNTTNAQITTTIYPTNSSMNTGYVTSTGAKYSDNMQVSTTSPNGRGWAKFPLSTIPAGSTVTAATIEFYTYGGVTSASVNSITGFTGDPVSMTGSTLYNTIGSGTSYNSSTWTIGSTTTPSLNSRVLSGGAAFVQGQIGTGYVNFGFIRGSTNLHSVYGFSNATYRVRLVVTYTLPPCSGTPAAGTANVNGNTSIQVCDNSSFSLNCTGQSTSTTNTGITANWQIGTSAGGPFSDISGASAATFSTSTTATRYYRYRVTCSNSGLSSYSNVLTVTYSPLSSPTASNQTITCGQTATLTASGAPIGGDYMWYSDATGTTQVGTGATFTTPALTTNTTYYVRSKLGLCNSALMPVTVTVNLAAGPTVTGTTLICASSSTTLTATGSGNPIQWYSDAAATNLLGTGTTYTTPSLSANTTYYVRQGANIPTFTYTSPVTATYTTGGAVSITVPSTPTGASGNGTLTVYLIGDLDAASETVDISSETGSVATGVYTGTQCSATYWSTTYSLTAANINSWAANGTINFNFQSTANVNNICTASAAFQVYVVLTYNYIVSPCNSSLTPVTVTVSPTSVAGTAGSNQTICSGATASINLTGQTGTIQWQQSANGTSGWSNVTTGTGATTSSYTSAALSATTYYRAVVTSGVCSSVNSNVVTITVNPTSVAGTAGSDQTICSGATASITLTGQTGTIQWQQSANGTSGWSNVTTGTGGTTSSYTSAALSATTYYRAVVTSGVCSSVNSNVVTVTVNPTSVAGTAGSNQTICSGATASITLTGQTGTIQWQQSTNGTSGWSNVTTGTGGTTSSYTSAALSATTYYRAVVTSGVCSSVNSNVVTITVSPTSVAGTAGSDQTICYNQTGSITLTGQTGTIQWQQSANGTSGWSNVTTGTGGTTTSYTSAALSATTYYRAVVTSGVCSSVNSNVVTVTVTPFLVVGTAGSDQTICSGATASLTLTGSTATTIQWRQSANGTTGWSDVTTGTGGTTSSYTSAALSATTYYRAYVTNGICSWGLSGLVTVTVSPTSVAGTAGSDQTICSGATASLTLTGQTGTIQWQQSANGTSGWSNVTTGTGGTTTSYTSAALSATTYYRARVWSGVCSMVYSNVVTVTINNTAFSVQPVSITSCAGNTEGFSIWGTVQGTIQWQQSANGTSGWSDVTSGTGATTSSYTFAVLSGTTYYRVVVTSGVCSVNSNVVTTTGIPASVAGTAGSNQTICSGATASLTLTGQTGTIQWQQSANGINGWSNVTTGTGATTTSYTSATLSATTYYRAVVKSGICSSVNSNVVTVTVNQPSVNPTSIAGSSICLGASTTLTAVGGSLGVGANYQWGTGLVIGSNPISAGATASTLSVSPTTTTAVYWVQIVNGTGPCSATTAGLTTTVTVITPTIATTPTAGSVVWRGATNTDWTTASNWYAYDGTNYTVATATPTASSSVIIPANQGCVTQQPAVAISGTVSANNLTIETGAALTMTTGTLNVAGNFTVNGTGTFSSGTGTVNFTGNGTQVLTNGTQSFNHVTINGFGTVQLTGNTTINGNYTNNSGSLNMNNFNLTVGGNYANYNSSAGLLPGTGTIIFNKASGTQTVDQLGLDFNHIQHTGAGTLQLLNDLSTTGDIINSAGTFDANDKIITVKNNFTNTATFTPGTGGLGEIYFEKAGGTQTLTPGNAVFQKFAHTGTGTLNLTGTVEVKGNVVIDAPISAGTSTMKLSGTGNQTMSGTQSLIALNSLTVAKTGGTVTLSKPVRVEGALTMTQGNIVTSSSNMLEIGSSTSSLGSVSWTAGNVIGPMRRWFAGATNSTPASGLFPVGLSTVNRYAQVNFTQAPGSGGYIDLEYKAGAPANAANWTYLTTPDGQIIQTFEDEGYWDITPYDVNGNAYPSGLNTSAFTMKLRANGLTSVNDISVTRIIRSPGPLHTTWEPAGFHIAATGTSADFAIESNTITGFSWFNIGSPDNNALPVELLNFNGTCNEGMVDLTWQTASEFNSSHFDVEKSTDGETWRVVATIPSAGTSTELLTYQTVDNNGTSGSNYYRLRQVDNDGKEKLYNPINVNCVETTTGYFTSYPNPSGSDFQVVVNDKEILGACTLNIVDAQGKVIDQRTIEVKDGINMFVISEELNPGIYFLNITNGVKTTEVIRHAVK